MDERTAAEEVLWDVEGEPYQFGKRIPKHIVGLVNALRGKNVVLLDIKEGLVYWMDCPKHILEACEPQPSRLVYSLEGEVEARGFEGTTGVHTGDEVEAEHSDAETEQGDKETPPTSDDEGDDDDDDDDNDDDDDVDDDDDGSDDEYDEIEWGPCWPIRHFFAMLKNHYMKLNFIPYGHRTVLDVWTDKSPAGKSIPEGITQLLRSIYHKNNWPDLEKFNKDACLAELKKELAEKYPDIHKYYRLDR